MMRHRVLVVDDSAMVRRLLTGIFSQDSGLDVVGEASNGDTALQMVRDLRPDVVTLDLDLPKVNGIEVLRRIMSTMPIPVVIVSGSTQDNAPLMRQALDFGAVDVISKPSLDASAAAGLGRMAQEICDRVRAAAERRPQRVAHTAVSRLSLENSTTAARGPRDRIFAIGSSTGGVQALSEILPRFPADAPPIVIVQHMPTGFTRRFAERLDEISAIRVREAADGDILEPGLALLAPGGDRHMILRGVGAGLRVSLTEGPPVCFSRPSVDVLFESVARLAGPRAVAAILTGMGRDGAAGMLKIREASGSTIAQDESSSIVYGMPLAAKENGGARQILSLERIPEAMMAATPGRREDRKTK
jgi:two-component system, chemotaxis family, protein-glutamate methylesterase/glutaminase